MPFFNIPDFEFQNSTDTGCPPGYSRQGDLCVSELTESVFKLTYANGYEFEYYENAGELIGRYRFIDNTVDNPEEELFLERNIQAAGNYFSQNVSVTKLATFNLDKPKQNLNKDESVLFIEVRHINDDLDTGEGTVEIRHPFLTDVFLENNPLALTEYYMGEYHHLTNTLRGIKRVNLNYQLLQELKEDDNWLYVKDNNLKEPSSNFTDGANQFIKWYYGQSKIPDRDRPPSLLADHKPTLPDPVLGTEWMSWKTINSVCTNFLRVYNGQNLGQFYQDRDMANGQFVTQFKIVVDEERLQEWLNNKFDTTSYPVNELTGKKEQSYQILFYPPSMYLYPANNPTEFDSPIVNGTNVNLTEVIFETPHNWKFDGNIHYEISFYEALSSTTPLFTSSSYEGSPHYEQFLWLYSTTGEPLDYSEITSDKPIYANLFDDFQGAGARSTTHIKYVLSDAIRLLLDGKPDIIFRIRQLDGTLLEPHLNN